MTSGYQKLNFLTSELYTGDPGIIMVCGGGVNKDGNLYTHVKERIDKSIEKLKDSNAAYIVMSEKGGSKLMEDYAIRNGVAGYKIRREDASTTTSENIKLTGDIYQSLPITGKHIESPEISIVSNYWHGIDPSDFTKPGRILEISKKELTPKGIEYEFVPAPDSRRDDDPSKIYDIRREQAALSLERSIMPESVKGAVRKLAGSIDRLKKLHG